MTVPTSQPTAHSAPPGLFRSPVVCRLTGISYRMLDSWARRGFVDAPESDGCGTARLWTARAVAQIQVAAAIRRAGLDLRIVREVVDRLDLLGWPDRRLGAVWVTLPDCDVGTVRPSLTLGQAALYLCVDERPTE